MYIQKINLIIHFFLKILQCKESCNFTGRQLFGPKLEIQNFARYGGGISTTILVFILDYFQEKLTWQNFSKNPKITILAPFWALFAQILTKNGFSWKKELYQFLNILIIYHCVKNQKKTHKSIFRKMLTCWTDKQTTVIW